MEKILLEKEHYAPSKSVMLSDIKQLRLIANETSQKIMEFLSKGPSYAEQISRGLHIDRQRIYYRMRKLENAGLIKLTGIENVNGSLAKMFSPVSETMSFRFISAGGSPNASAREYTLDETIFYDFIENGVFNGFICVGSPDPHGEFRAVSRDTNFAIYLGMHIGSLAVIPDYFPIVLDSDLLSRNLMGKNLIIIGGPVSNTVTMKINEHLPVNFSKEAGLAISDGSKVYSVSTIGLIEKVVNPYNPEKRIVILAGNSNQGTLSAILGATKFWKKIYKGDSPNEMSMILQGYDDDSDGLVDSIERIK